jgi:hypothetical protein
MTTHRSLALVAAAVTAIALMAVGAALGTGTDEKKALPRTGFIQGKVISGESHPER